VRPCFQTQVLEKKKKKRWACDPTQANPGILFPLAVMTSWKAYSVSWATVILWEKHMDPVSKKLAFF
jgi:hypothetical protein